jgi:predicted enzyme involved in methoxymalonyl-ACP biosynthesis
LQQSTDIIEAEAAYARAVASKDAAAMMAFGHALFSLIPTLGTAQRLLNSLPLDLPRRAGVRLKVAFLRSYTVEPVIPLLRAMATLQGVELTIKVGEFNSYAQEVPDPASWLYQFNPDVIFLACQTRDLASDLWHGSGDVSAADAESIVGGIVTPLVSLVDRLRTKSNASLIIQNLEQPNIPSAGLLDSRRKNGQ